MNHPITTFKKGDRVYLVRAVSGQGAGWEPTSESFRIHVIAELVTLTSLGKVQGTAVTINGNLKRRICVNSTSELMMATREEVEAYATSIGTERAAVEIVRHKLANIKWVQNYATTGTPLGFQRNAIEAAALAKCVPLSAIIHFS